MTHYFLLLLCSPIEAPSKLLILLIILGIWSRCNARNFGVFSKNESNASGSNACCTLGRYFVCSVISLMLCLFCERCIFPVVRLLWSDALIVWLVKNRI